jgi:hypothetical protein
MTDFILLMLALAMSGAYACRVDLLSWRLQPLLMAVHVVGGLAAIGVVALVSQTGATAWHGVMLACSGALLAATYRRLPAQQGGRW